MNRAFLSALGQSDLSRFTTTCKDCDVIFLIGSLPSRHNRALAQEIVSCVDSGAKLIYLFTMEDPILSPKSTFFSRYEVGSEEGVLALLAKSFLAENSLSEAYRTYFSTLDDGYVSAESNIGEEEIEEIETLCAGVTKGVLILGEDLFYHPRAEQIARFAGLIARHTPIKLQISGTTQHDWIAAEETMVEEVEDIASFDGVVVYECPCLDTEEERFLIGSSQFQAAAKVQHDEAIHVVFDRETYPRVFVRDERLKGVIALLPLVKANNAYPYHVTKIVK